MLKPVQTRISLEFEKLNSFPEKTRKLLLSFLFNGATGPLFGTFTNAYIWRIEGNFLGVVLFNFGSFISLPITFLLNGFLLRFISIGVLYAIGNITLGLGVMTVILLAKLGFYYYFIYGFIIGIGYGFYWSNRNYLTLKETQSANRNYFMGITSTLDTITSIIVPFVVGWFIYYGSILGFETYVISAVFAFLFLIVAGLLVFRGNYETPQISSVVMMGISKRWKDVRILMASIGVIDGLAAFLVSMLILENLGHEGTLGTVDSVVSIILGVLFYYFGRKAEVHHQRSIYLSSVFVGVVGTVFLLLRGTDVFSVTVFTVFYYFAIAFMWLSAEPMIMDIMDREIGDNDQNRYAHVFDRELFLNIGRWVSILLFGGVFFLSNIQTALHLTPVLTFALHSLVLVLIWKRLGTKLK